MYGIVTTLGPAAEPVTVGDAKLHARIDLDVEDNLVVKWIRAAREYAEDHTSKVWANRTLKLTLPNWPCEMHEVAGLYAIELPFQPVSSVTSVKYYNVAGVQTTLVQDVDYQTWLEFNPPLIAPAPARVWPTLQPQRFKPIEIVFVAGYGASSGWPARAEQAIFMAITYWNRNRGDGRDPTMLGLPDGAIRLLDSLWSGAY